MQCTEWRCPPSIFMSNIGSVAGGFCAGHVNSGVISLSRDLFLSSGPGLQRNPRLPGAATSCARESYDVKDEQKHVREEHRYGRTVKGRANQEKTKHDFLFGRAKLSSPQ